VAIVFFTYRLARDVIGEEGALLLTFLIATDNLIVLVSRSARPEALTVMAVLASPWAMKQYSHRGQIAWTLASGLLIGTGKMFHVTVLGWIVSIGVLAIVLDSSRASFPLNGAIGFAVGFVVALVPFAAWILTSPLGSMGFRGEYLSRAAGGSLWSRLLGEGARYSDLFGLNLLHGHGLEFFPVRLPIPFLFLAASVLLWRLRRRWFFLEVLLLAPTVLWLIYTLNKSSRYLALLAPIFALAIGAAVAATGANRRLHRIVRALCCLVIVAQLSRLLFSCGQPAVRITTRCRGVALCDPPGQTAYGTITFWLALHDRPFISYERTDHWKAVNPFQAR